MHESLEDDIWGDIYGHGGAKTVVSAALRQGDIHCLLEGPPGSGKSVFLFALESKIPGVVYRDGDGMTASKLRDVLKDDPPILLIDEIDALSNDAYDVLAIPMEHGRIVRDSATESYDVSVGTQIIGACNDISELPDHIQDRFRTVHFTAYSDEDYLELCEHMLPKNVEWIETEEQARAAAQKILDITGEPDPRNARDISRMARSVDEIETLSAAMDNPDADIDAGPLRLDEIKRAEGAANSIKIRERLVRECRTDTREEIEREIETAIVEETGAAQ